MAFVLFQDARAVRRFSLASAYVGLALVVASLIIGPLNVLRRRPNPVSSGLRRDVGIWAALVGIGHVVAGIQVHFPGRPWLYFIYDRGQARRIPLRHDIFGAANYTGLGATLVLALLLALSNDRALRALGTARWKRIQRYNYLGFILISIHAFVFQAIEKRVLPLVGLCGAIIVGTGVLQLAGYRARRQANSRLGGVPRSS